MLVKILATVLPFGFALLWVRVVLWLIMYVKTAFTFFSDGMTAFPIQNIFFRPAAGCCSITNKRSAWFMHIFRTFCSIFTGWYLRRQIGRVSTLSQPSILWIFLSVGPPNAIYWSRQILKQSHSVLDTFGIIEMVWLSMNRRAETILNICYNFELMTFATLANLLIICHHNFPLIC